MKFYTPIDNDETVVSTVKIKSEKYQVELCHQERKRGCTRGCRDIAYGMCFCRTDSGEYYY